MILHRILKYSRRKHLFKALQPPFNLQSDQLLLYAHYSNQATLPEFVHFVFDQLPSEGWQKVLLTNIRTLSSETLEWCRDHQIQLVMLQNEGYDFGMWGKILASIQPHKLKRLWLLNDSVLFFRPVLKEFHTWAEEQTEQALSMADNQERFHHMQSWCLYLKNEAIIKTWEHMERQGIIRHYKRVVQRLEIGLSRSLNKNQIPWKAYHHQRPGQPSHLMNSAQMIRQQCGFIKRKLLENRFNSNEKNFLKRQGYASLYNTDWVAFIQAHGKIDASFHPEWLLPPKTP